MVMFAACVDAHATCFTHRPLTLVLLDCRGLELLGSWDSQQAVFFPGVFSCCFSSFQYGGQRQRHCSVPWAGQPHFRRAMPRPAHQRSQFAAPCRSEPHPPAIVTGPHHAARHSVRSCLSASGGGTCRRLQQHPAVAAVPGFPKRGTIRLPGRRQRDCRPLICSQGGHHTGLRTLLRTCQQIACTISSAPAKCGPLGGLMLNPSSSIGFHMRGCMLQS